MADSILEVRDLYAHYGSDAKPVKAVDGVSFSLKRGSILALVGESGCGKTSTALAIMGLLSPPGRVVKGEVSFEGVDLLKLSGAELRHIRGREISFISQDPAAGLNPVLSIGDQVEEIIRTHTNYPKEEVRRLVGEALSRVGLADPEHIVKRYPYQLSGGMSQRVVIAIATVLNPKVVIADEPTSALDVTVQAGILDELDRLRRERGVSILLITHDMGIVAQLADEVAVMYGGRIAEYGATRDIFRHPRHPYTWSLLATLPRLDKIDRPLQPIKGSPPDAAELPDECAFLPRCPKAVNECRISPSPPLVELKQGQSAACYNPVVHLEE